MPQRWCHLSPLHIITSPVPSCHGSCCWCRSHFPCPAWSLSGSQLTKHSTPHVRLSEQYVAVRLLGCVLCVFRSNICLLLTSADISLFECVCVLSPSRVCLFVDSIQILQVLERLTVCSIVLCSVWNVAWLSYAWQLSSVC